jgi:cytochrome c2
MPDFALAEAEAAALASFLTATSTGKHTPDPSEFPPGDATRGQAATKSLACAACHTDLPATVAPELAKTPSLEALAGKDWRATGCLADDSKPHPHFPQLKEDDRAALAAFATAGFATLSRHVPAEFAKSFVASHRCTTCHAADGRPALLDSLHPESSKLVAHLAGHAETVDQTRPQLTYLGEMLHASFIASMLDGKATPRPRPWLEMRMPAFHDHPAEVAAGIARQHGIVPSDPSVRPHFDDPAGLAKIGAALVGTQDGFACTICHAINGQKATAVFEAEGVNLAHAQNRLRYEYFQRWLDDPTRVTPGTKMPKYTSDGKSPLGQHLNGDARKQFDALWEYLHTLPQPAAE